MPLPDPLNGHSCREKTIGNSKDGKNYDKDNNQGKASLHGSGEAVKNAPPIAAVAASSHAWIVVIERRAVQYEPEKPKQHKENHHPCNIFQQGRLTIMGGSAKLAGK